MIEILSLYNVTVLQDTDFHMTSLGDLCIRLALFAGFKSQNTPKQSLDVHYRDFSSCS